MASPMRLTRSALVRPGVPGGLRRERSSGIGDRYLASRLAVSPGMVKATSEGDGAFLDDRHLLERVLHPQVTARHHQPVERFEDLGQALVVGHQAADKDPGPLPLALRGQHLEHDEAAVRTRLDEAGPPPVRRKKGPSAGCGP